MKEISRRAYYFEEDGGMACGPCGGATSVDVEMVIEDEGKTVYLRSQWVDLCKDEFYFSANTASLLDMIIKVYNNEDNDDELEKINAIEKNGVEEYFPGCDINDRYAEQKAELLKITKTELAAHGIDVDELFNDYDFDDEDCCF